MEVVENSRQKALVKIGVGSKEHEPALRKLGCDTFYEAQKFELWMAEEIPILRVGDADIITVVNPRLLAPITIQRIALLDIPIEVVGHKPWLPKGYEERKQLRALKAKLPEGQKDVTGPGRPVEIDAPKAAIEDAIEWWRDGKKRPDGSWKSTYTPTEIVEKLRLKHGLEVEKHWARDQAFKRFASYKRDPNQDPKRKKT